MHNEQAIRTGKSGADHKCPQQRQRGGNAIANRHGDRVGPGVLQPITQCTPQYRQRQRHQNRPEHGTDGQTETILGDLTDFTGRTFKKGIEVAARADAETDQQQRTNNRQHRIAAGKHHRHRFAELTQRIQRQQAGKVFSQIQRITQTDRTDVSGPEQIAVRRVFDFRQRILQLGIADLELGDLQNQGVTAGDQGVEQFTLGA